MVSLASLVTEKIPQEEMSTDDPQGCGEDGSCWFGMGIMKLT